MGLKVSESKPFTTDVPEDTHPAVCVGIFDLGTVHNKQYGKDEQKVLILWELTELPKKEGIPATIQQQYTASLGEKSNLRRMLTTWRGKPFTEAELAGFDVKKVLGMPCQILVLHSESNGNKYANVHNVMGWPKGIPAPKHVLPHMVFEFGTHTELPASTPKWVASKIEAAPEWQERYALAGKSEVDFGAAPTGSSPEIVAAINSDDDSDIPF
jgi:hypothetical protein